MVGLRYLEGTGFNFTSFMGRVNNCRMITMLAPRLDYFPSDRIKEEDQEEETVAEEQENLLKINNEVVASLAYQTENHLSCKDWNKLFACITSDAMICNVEKDLWRLSSESFQPRRYCQTWGRCG